MKRGEPLTYKSGNINIEEHDGFINITRIFSLITFRWEGTAIFVILDCPDIINIIGRWSSDAYNK